MVGMDHWRPSKLHPDISLRRALDKVRRLEWDPGGASQYNCNSACIKLKL